MSHQPLFRFPRYLLPAITLFIVLSTIQPSYAQDQDDYDPFLVPSYARKKASLPLAYGFFAHVDMPISNQNKSERGIAGVGTGKVYVDEWVWGPQLNVYGYYDVWQVGFHIKNYGTMFSITNRFWPSRDHYGGVRVEVGFSRFDQRMLYGMGIGGSLGGRYFVFMTDLSAGLGRDIHFFHFDIGLGLRIPLQQFAITLGGKGIIEAMTPNSRKWVVGTPTSPEPPPSTGEFIFALNPFVTVSMNF